jgi:hypothetical protein
VSRGLGDVYKRQKFNKYIQFPRRTWEGEIAHLIKAIREQHGSCKNYKSKGIRK